MGTGFDTRFIFCPRCGALMEPPYCNVCGYDLRNVPVEEPVAQPMVSDPNPNPPMPEPEPVAETPSNAQKPLAQPPVNAQQPQIILQKVDEVEKKARKKKKWVIIGIAIGVVGILLIIAGPVIALIRDSMDLAAARKRAGNINQPGSSIMASGSDSEIGSELTSEAQGVVGKRHFGRFDHQGLDFSFYENMADVAGKTASGAYDPFLNKDNVTVYNDSDYVFDASHTNYKPEQMGPDYYEPFCDCIDEISYSDQYQIHREYYFFDDMMGSQRVIANVAYAQLSGNIPNLDALNQEIFERSASDLLNFYNGSSVYSMYVFNQIVFSTDSYIVYNDGKKMSILLDVVVHTDDYSMNLDSYIYAINIDLENGVIIENDQILNLDETFAADFRRRCYTQNGSNSALDPWDNTEVCEFLNDKETNIVFFTPLGIEIGMCYVGEEDILSRGWMTVTLKTGEYERRYLMDQSLTSTGKAGRDPKDPQYSDLNGTWIHIDPDLAKEEMEAFKATYPNYNWDELDFLESETPKNNFGKKTGGTTEEESEEKSEEPSDADPGESSSWKKGRDGLKEYFDSLPKKKDGEKFTSDEYFRIPR